MNAETLLDVRQTRYDPLVRDRRAPDGRWTVDAWAPLEGFTLNGGVRVRFCGHGVQPRIAVLDVAIALERMRERDALSFKAAVNAALSRGLRVMDAEARKGKGPDGSGGSSATHSSTWLKHCDSNPADFIIPRGA